MAAARQEVVINAPPNKIWSLLGDVSKWPSWNSRVTSGKMLEGDVFYPGATFQFTYDGKPRVGTIIQIDRLKVLVWRFDKTRLSMRLEPSGQTTKVICECEAGASGLFGSFNKSKLEQEAAQACTDWLQGLKQGVEKAG